MDDGATALPISLPGSTYRAREIVKPLKPKLLMTSSIYNTSPFHGIVLSFHISDLNSFSPMKQRIDESFNRIKINR